MGNAFHRLAPAHRLLTRRLGAALPPCGIAACLCLVVSTGAHAATRTAKPADPQAVAAVYRQAMEAFNKEDYSHALSLVDHAPEGGTASEQADLWNLRGAIDLHLHRYDQAKVAFAKASEKDPHLWAAKFNQAEVSFRQNKYDQSARQFEELLGQTSRIWRPDERAFLQYKRMLSDLLAGKEKPAQDFIAEHRHDRQAPLAYYYLNAATEHRHGHSQQAEQWLGEAGAQSTPASERVFAESFRELGWSTEHADRLAAAHHPDSTPAPASMAVVSLMPGQQPVDGQSPAKIPSHEGTEAPATTGPRPTFRASAAPAFPGNELPPDGEMPPPAAPEQANQQPAANPLPGPPDPRAVYSTPVVLGKSAASRKSAATPAPTAAADSSSTTLPPGNTATSSPSPASSPSGPPPSPAFVKKYEEAYVKFVEKDYHAAKSLLDEADAIQPNQPDSVKLRMAIFKIYYEAAYLSFKRGDPVTASSQLDEADAVIANQPDALNLRGLVRSRQKNYEDAEVMFKKAIQADPTFWAAKFNYAELPFNYRNYTAARTRFEDLFAQTDASKLPRESELAQFKVFLTLLLEGKVDAARSFMGHFNFTGITPARYFCQAALDFYAGNMDRANGYIASATKDYPAGLVSIFKESFVRIGWLGDVNNPGAAIAGGPPAAAPTDGNMPASTDAAPAGSPAASTLLAKNAVPSPSPIESVAPGASPSVAGSTGVAAPAVASGSPSPAIVASATPTTAIAPGAGTGSPAVAAASPGVSPLSSTPSPAASVVAIPATVPAIEGETPSPGPTTASASNSPSSEEEPAGEADTAAAPSPRRNLLRAVVLSAVVLNFAWSMIRILMAVLNKKPRRVTRRMPVRSDDEEVTEPDEVQAPR